MKAAEVQTMMSRGINQVRTLQIIKAVDDDSNDVSMYINVDPILLKWMMMLMKRLWYLLPNHQM